MKQEKNPLSYSKEEIQEIQELRIQYSIKKLQIQLKTIKKKIRKINKK